MSHWLTVDPGETTGWAIFDSTLLVASGQDPLWEFIDRVDLTLEAEPGYGCDQWGLPVEAFGAIVCEDWSLYPWVMQTGALDFDKCRTARGIGALTLLGRQHSIPFILQGADIKDGAKAAGAEELFTAPRDENRHANDAIMHGVFYVAKNGGPPC